MGGGCEIAECPTVPAGICLGGSCGEATSWWCGGTETWHSREEAHTGTALPGRHKAPTLTNLTECWRGIYMHAHMYLHACACVSTSMHTLLVHMHTQHLHTCTHSTYKLPCSSVSSSINGDHNNPRRRDVESEYMAMWEALRKEPRSHCAPSFVFVVVSGSLISGT